jgi:hypothetical protein
MSLVLHVLADLSNHGVFREHEALLVEGLDPVPCLRLGTCLVHILKHDGGVVVEAEKREGRSVH